MPLTLKIVSEHADLVGDDCVREFRDEGGTIGRALQNDWILPDPDRYISGRHATIDHNGGIYYLIDTSSNGVYVNGEYEPIGQGNPRRLFNGDELRMGDFIFEVHVDGGETIAVPLDDDDEPVIDPDIEQFVDEDSLRTGVQLLDEEEITGDDEFQSALFGDGQPESMPEPDVMEIFEAPERPKKSGKSKNLEVTAEDLFDSFLDGLGLNRADLHPSVNRPEMLLTAGQLLRELVKGSIDLLANRANLKNAFRLDQTTLLPRHNNPMKFSENTNELLKQLLTGGEGDYLGAVDSIREVNRDLLNHQNAFLDAMTAAFVEFADRFEPTELQEGFDRTLGSGLLSFTNKSKYWDLFCDLYPIITEKGGGRFPQMFAEEFVSAYERQVGEYRRHDREGTAPPRESHSDDIDPDFLTTQKLESPAAVQEAAFEEDDVIDSISSSGAAEIDQNFIEELENSMIDEAPKDKRKA
ncbi:MAG: type VI secretion system-associated FHA domain protein TagH [Pseudomonadota bacterium]